MIFWQDIIFKINIIAVVVVSTDFFIVVIVR